MLWQTVPDIRAAATGNARSPAVGRRARREYISIYILTSQPALGDIRAVIAIRRRRARQITSVLEPRRHRTHDGDVTRRWKLDWNAQRALTSTRTVGRS